MLSVALAGCETANDGFDSSTVPGQNAGSSLGASAFSRARPVPAPAAATLEGGPSGARLDYVTNGRSVSFTLGPIYQSGLQTSCRIGRARTGGGHGDAPTAYAFCRDGKQWYEMPPVVVSGY